jgi:multiple sugar transport system permease protein
MAVLLARLFKKHNLSYWRDAVAGYLFVMPVILGLLIWTLAPMVASFYISFTKYSILKPPEFIGLKNYVDMFTKPHLRVMHSLWVTFKYAMLSLPLKLVVSLIAALLLNRKLKGVRFLRTALYMPTIVPGIALTFVWSWLLNPEWGLVNWLLGSVGLPTPNWLADPKTALLSLVLLNLWTIGGTMVIFLAGLQNIPEELYEAGKIDGANRLQLLFRITIPMLSPTIFFNFVMGMIGSFQYFLQPFVMTKGGPFFKTYVYNLNLYEKAFQWFKMGQAAAMAWLMFAIILLLTLFVFRTSDAFVYYEVES